MIPAFSYLDFVPTDHDDYLEKLYLKANNQQRWEIFVHHPETINKFHKKLSESSRWNLFTQNYQEKIRAEFLPSMTDEQVWEVFEREIKKRKES